jgi:hypothetical protein
MLNCLVPALACSSRGSGQRVRPRAARVAMSAVATAWTTTWWPTCGRRPDICLGGRPPRTLAWPPAPAWPGVPDTSRPTAAVPEAADGQSVDGSGSVQPSPPFLKAGPAGGRLRRPSSAGSTTSWACDPRHSLTYQQMEHRITHVPSGSYPQGGRKRTFRNKLKFRSEQSACPLLRGCDGLRPECGMPGSRSRV